MSLNLQSLRSALLWLPVTLRESWRWRSCQPSPPRVFYGFDRLPSAQEMGHGGIIKVQDLQREFPNTPRGANLLYLISSYVPLFAPGMARFARRAGVRLVINQNGVAYPGWYGQGWERANADMQSLLMQADHVVYQSQFCKDTADRYLGSARCPWEILNNPVDTELFVPAVADPAPQGQFVMLLAGSHGAWYRVKTAIEALAVLRKTLPGARLLVAGRYAWRTDQARAKAEAQRYAAELGVADAMELAGAYTQSEAVALLQRAHVLLHTKYNDPCPRLVVEAMACGLPVVYSTSGGVPELVGTEAGIGIPAPCDYEADHPPDAVELARALSLIAAERTRFAHAARQRAVANFDVRPWLERHRAIFTRLLQWGSS